MPPVMVARCLSFLVILQSLFALTKPTPQLNWSVTKATPQERRKSKLEKEILSKIFRQIQKNSRRAIKRMKLSQRYLINWIKSGRRLSPLFPLVSLELERFKNGSLVGISKEGKFPAMIHWGKLLVLRFATLLKKK